MISKTHIHHLTAQPPQGHLDIFLLLYAPRDLIGPVAYMEFQGLWGIFVICRLEEGEVQGMGVEAPLRCYATDLHIPLAAL